MPALPDQSIYHKADDGTEFRATVTCSVTTTGDFRMGVPKELEEIATSFMKSQATNPDRVQYSGEYRADGRVRISAKVLAYLRRFLEACAEEYLSVETIKDRVILYCFEAKGGFCVAKDGSLHPNGHIPGSQEDAEWYAYKARMNHEFSMARHHGISILLGAEVWDKITYKRASGDVVKWERVRYEDHHRGGRLNDFSGVDLDPRHHSFKEMPWTQQAEDFFIKMLLVMCSINKGLDEFLSDEKRMLKMIKSGATFRLVQ